MDGPSGHLSPAQFGFVEGSHDDWMDAQRHWSENGGKPVRLDLSKVKLHTGQPGIFPERVQEYVEHPGLKSATAHSGFGKVYDSPVEVYHHNDSLWVGEGHHRLAAAMQRGQKTARAKLYE